MNLVDDDELADLGTQKRVRVLEAPLISRTLKVKVYRPPLSQVSAHLPRPEENYPRHSPQALFEDGAEPSRDHSDTGILTTDVNTPVSPCRGRS